MHQDFTITKYLDRASPLINQNCCMGTVSNEVLITVGRNDAGVILPLIEYSLEEVLISSVSVGGGGGGKPVETVSLNYSRIEWVYVVGGEDEKVVAAWDLTKSS